MDTKIRIIFNGQSYTDPSAMPAQVRQAYQKALGLLEDANKNGIPDVLETAGLGNLISIQQSQIVVNGQSYDRPEDMPPAVRQLYDQALSHLDAAPSQQPRLMTSSVSIQGGRLALLVGAVILGFILAAIWLG
jgi:hypothetical protein